MKSLYRTLALAALYISIVPVRGFAQQASLPQLKAPEVTRLSINGRALSAEDANKLEQNLISNPNDVAARVSLIAYYSAHRDESFTKKKDDQALWFIRNMADSEMLRWIVQVRLDPMLDERFAQGKQLWLDNLNKYQGNTTVIANAANFFLISDKPFAEKLIEEAARLEPTNPRWPSELGHLLMMEMRSAKGGPRPDLAARAYDQYSLAYRITTAAEKPFILTQLPVAAFEAGDLKHAREWALEILSQAATNQNPTLVDAVHHAHIVLGRLALVNGDMGEAKARLVLAGQTAGSPAMKSFGPNMSLAKDLLEKGERETVIKYFEECASFWKDDRERLAQWTTQVRAGETPQFGANLAY